VSALRRELLQAVVEVARAIFLAEAASIAVLDHESGEFVFTAVAGTGEEIVGSRFAAGKGLAGMVAQSGEPLIVDDLAGESHFARDVAESTGYVPNAMMVAPLIRGEDTLGVLSVLDRGATGRKPLEELELLARCAAQAAVSLEATADAPAVAPQIAALARRLDAVSHDRRGSAERLLASLSELLAPDPGADDDGLER
jgi:signal transduction protein with GAF and PtsI domain